MPVAGSAQVVHGVGALLRGLVAEPVQDLRDLLWEGRLQLPPPLAPHQVMQQHLQGPAVSVLVKSYVSSLSAPQICWKLDAYSGESVPGGNTAARAHDTQLKRGRASVGWHPTSHHRWRELQHIGYSALRSDLI